MSTKKILTIFGATGNQGGSVISTVLANPTLSSEFTLRGITRDTTSSKAQALSSKGVQLTQANLDDLASIKTALADSYGVFGLTDYWATTQKSIEVAQGKAIVDASLAVGVKHLVLSTLPNVTKLTEGELSGVEHFDSKAEVAAYAHEKKGGMIVSNFMPGFFMSNLLKQVKKTDDGVVISLPWNAEKTWVPLIDIRSDVGKFVVGLFAAGKEADGVTVHGTSQWVHPSEIVSLVSELSGMDVKFVEQKVTVEMTLKMERIPRELAQNMLLIRDYSYFGKGTERMQEESDRWLAKGTKVVKWDEFARGQKWEVQGLRWEDRRLGDST